MGKAKPLFRGHYQPQVPADLGYYDLRVPKPVLLRPIWPVRYGVEDSVTGIIGSVTAAVCWTDLLRRCWSPATPIFLLLVWANHSWHGIYYRGKE